MSGRLRRVSLLGAVLFGLLAVPVLAAEAAATDSSTDVAHLKAVLDAQQAKIEALEQQVAQAAQQDADKGRVEQMRQQIREILNEQEFRESLMSSTTQAGYNNGFFIRSTDDKFMLKINGQMQFRWTHYATRSENRYLSPGMKRHDRTGFDIARMRLRFSGNAYDKDLTYLVEMDMSSPSGYDARLFYAWVNYRFVDEFQIKAGVFRTNSTRANRGSTATMQSVDYPTMDAVFGLNNALGVRFWGYLFDKRGEYSLDVVNSVGAVGGQTITTDENVLDQGHDNNPGLIFNTTWHLLTGECAGGATPATEKHFDGASDIENHVNPALDLGFHYAYNEDWHDGTLRIPFARRGGWLRDGGFGLTSSEGLQIHQFGFDAAFKWRGFSATGEYVLRIQDVRHGDGAPYTPLYLLTGDGSTNAQHGAYVQCGYFLPIPGLENKLEVMGRVGGMSALAGGQEGTWEYSGGLNYYLQGHKVKIQTDVTKVSESPISSATHSLANVNDDALIWRIQMQVAF